MKQTRSPRYEETLQQILSCRLMTDQKLETVFTICSTWCRVVTLMDYQFKKILYPYKAWQTELGLNWNEEQTNFCIMVSFSFRYFVSSFPRKVSFFNFEQDAFNQFSSIEVVQRCDKNSASAWLILRCTSFMYTNKGSCLTCNKRKLTLSWKGPKLNLETHEMVTQFSQRAFQFFAKPVPGVQLVKQSAIVNSAVVAEEWKKEKKKKKKTREVWVESKLWFQLQT